MGLKIVGVTGYKRAGKDTAVLGMQTVWPFPRIGFSDHLREVITEVYDLSPKQLDEDKDQPLPAPISLSSRLSQLKRITGLTDMPDPGLVAHSGRQVLQFIGTDYVRAARPNYWVEHALQSVRAAGGAYMPDLRFHNEASAIWAAGGIAMRVLRPSLHIDPTKVHESERFVPLLRVLGEVVNDTTAARLQSEARSLVWDYLSA